MKKDLSRTAAAGKNLRSNAAGIFINIFFSFFSRKIFILVLGKEYVGLSSLIGNITVLISLFDLGSAGALTYKLYSAISESDSQKISSYLHFYRRFCMLSAFLTTAAGLILVPHLEKIVSDFQDLFTLRTVFLIYILSNALGYFFSAEKILLFADQKNYVCQIFSYIFGAITLVAQSAVLVVFSNYVAYLLTGTLLCLAEDFLLRRYVRKSYNDIDFSHNCNIDKSCKKELLHEMINLQPSNIASTLSRTVDNFLVVFLFGVAQNGVYSNYNLLLSYAGMLSVTFVSSISASVGSLGASSSKKHSKKIFGMTNLCSFFLSNICTTILFVMSQDIITLWLGENLTLSTACSAAVALCFFVSSTRRTTIVFRDSFGLYSHEKIKPFAELFLFVIMSLFFGRRLGICGIYLAQALSAVLISFWYEPYVLFKYGFGESVFPYYKKLFAFSLCCASCCFCAFLICRIIPFVSLKAAVCIFVSVIFSLGFFGASEDMKEIFKRFCK